MLEFKHPLLSAMLDRFLVSDYTEFIRILNEDIHRCITEIEKNRELIEKEEDAVTIRLINGLNMIGYNASHDKKNGGHVDLTVEKEAYLWLGEAKIFSDNNYLWEGVLQLITRYTIGRHNQNAGGVLIYIFEGNVKEVMDAWKQYITNKGFLKDCTHTQCTIDPFAFHSKFTHDISGIDFTFRNIPLFLQFKPQDKSARKAKKNN